MGLDITAYKWAARLEPQPVLTDDDDPWDEGLVHVYALKPFDHALAGLTVTDGELPGTYDGGWFVVGHEKIEFRAGSYGGYSAFRDNLAIAALGVGPQVVWTNPADYSDRPFYELIHFADNEGTIGPLACAALAADFKEQRETVLPKWDPADETQAWFRTKYDEWQQAFELSANTGLVVFS